MTVFPHQKTQNDEDINMADQTKNSPEFTDVMKAGHQHHNLNATEEENTVGYKEYIEGRDIEILEKEVSLVSFFQQ
jgi:2',3'-cyclic-nucleotide 2'-phosphodiesterase (5'-nucleotidase family)